MRGLQFSRHSRQLSTLLLALLLIGVSGAVSAQGGSWQVISAEPLPPANYFSGFLSADGQAIVYTSENDAGVWLVCRDDLVTLEQVCLEIPREFGGNMKPDSWFPPLTLSPDGTRAAVVGYPYRYFRDTDLSLADFSAGTLTNLADDAYQDDLMFDLPASGAVVVDSQPAWSPDGTQLAVERSILTGGDTPSSITTLTVINLADGSARDITRLPGSSEYERDLGTVIGLAWSPDGTRLAFSLRHSQPDSRFDGLWTVDVATGELVQLLTLDNLPSPMLGIFPNVDPEALVVFMPQWSPDGSRLSFWIHDLAGNNTQFWCFTLDAAGGPITTLVPPSAPGPANIGNVPYAATWSPDSSALLLAFRLAEKPDDLKLLPPLDELPEDSQGVQALYLADAVTGQAAFLGHLPLFLSPSLNMTWLPDNTVTVPGYRLTLG